MDEIERLAKKAEAAPGASPTRSRARLAEQVAALLESSDRFDPDRLNQEALLVAAKADIREELDRIASHIEQAREMIGKGGPIGRRLDFLAQEFNREGQYLLLQVERPGIDQYRPRDEERGRAIPRAGSEFGVRDDGWRPRLRWG
jgi:uncharacterized protein (TIGR00255 family)